VVKLGNENLQNLTIGKKNPKFYGFHELVFDYLLALPKGKRVHICGGFGLGDKILDHSLANVEMTSVHIMKIFTWM
jgi:hypothetical protein